MWLFRTTLVVLSLPVLNYALISFAWRRPVAPASTAVPPADAGAVMATTSRRGAAAASAAFDRREEVRQPLPAAILAHAACLSAFPLHPACGHPAFAVGSPRSGGGAGGGGARSAGFAAAAMNASSSSRLSPPAQLAVRKLDALLEIKQRSFQCKGDDSLGLYGDSAPASHAKYDLRYLKAVVRSVKVASKQQQQQQQQQHSHHRHQAKRETLYIAALLHDNAKVFPFWSREVLKLILSSAPPEGAAHANRFGHVFVAIYESGSVDNTPKLLRHFDAILADLGIPRWIRATGDVRGDTDDDEVYSMLSAAGGRSRGQALGNDDIPFGAAPHEASKEAWSKDRIGRLALLRNVVLGPMLLGSATFDRVVYLNDVFFCASGAKELISRSVRHSTDMVCSTDYTEKVRGASLLYIHQ